MLCRFSSKKPSFCRFRKLSSFSNAKYSFILLALVYYFLTLILSNLLVNIFYILCRAQLSSSFSDFCFYFFFAIDFLIKGNSFKTICCGYSPSLKLSLNLWIYYWVLEFIIGIKFKISTFPFDKFYFITFSSLWLDIISFTLYSSLVKL